MFEIEKYEEPLRSLQNAIVNETIYDKPELLYVYLFVVSMLSLISSWVTGKEEEIEDAHSQVYFDSKIQPELKQESTRVWLNMLHLRVVSSKQPEQNLGNLYVQLRQFAAFTHIYLTKPSVIGGRHDNHGFN